MSVLIQTKQLQLSTGIDVKVEHDDAHNFVDDATLNWFPFLVNRFCKGSSVHNKRNDKDWKSSLN